MALIQCPECGQSVSDKAPRCPKCGYSIQEYLKEKEEADKTPSPDGAVLPENSRKTPQGPSKKNRKTLIFAAAACAAVIIAGVLLIAGKNTVSVDDISISKWRLTDAGNYSDSYEGTVTAEQKKPFIAVIGQYDEEEQIPKFVYMENGEGTLETYEDSEDDPSIKYRAIGYLTGKAVRESDVKIKYTDKNYSDSSYSESSSCSVTIDMEMNKTKTGLLLFDIVNETNKETERNLIATVVDGKTEYNYYASLPYKARGIDLSIVPKFFVESKAIKSEDYRVEKAYSVEKDEDYWTSYSGEETFAFPDFSDGLLLYTKELTDGGNKENRNVLKYLSAFIHAEECTLHTYDYADTDQKILTPQYEFALVGYLTWETLGKENH